MEWDKKIKFMHFKMLLLLDEEKMKGIDGDKNKNKSKFCG